MSYINVLNDFQRGIFEECLSHRHIGLSVPMGGGKTRISLAFALTVCSLEPILVVCKKTLIGNWIDEINKAFGGAVSYYVFHKEYDKNFKNVVVPPAMVVITTPEVLRTYYESARIDQRLRREEIVNEGEYGQHTIIHYERNLEPQEDFGFIYGRRWGVIIVDEFDSFASIESKQGRCILALSGSRKMALSGTFFSETKTDRVMPFVTFAELDGFPNTIPELSEHIRDPDFVGIEYLLVSRKELPFKIETKEHRINVNFTADERKIYESLRTFTIEIRNHVRTLIGNRDANDERRRFSGALLAMLVILRQAIVCPLIPITSMMLEIIDRSTENGIIAERFRSELEVLDIDDYLNNEQSIISSRIEAALHAADRHDRVVMFTCHRTVVDIMMIVVKHRPIFTLEGNMPSKKREEIIDQCRNSDNFILVLTYSIGSCGLNLQVANTVVFVDFEWNQAVTKQAEARVKRFGQNEVVNVYYIVSNTGVENAILTKQIQKADASRELMTGPITTKIEKIKTDEIITLMEEEILSEKVDRLYITAPGSGEEVKDDDDDI